MQAQAQGEAEEGQPQKSPGVATSNPGLNI